MGVGGTRGVAKCRRAHDIVRLSRVGRHVCRRGCIRASYSAQAWPRVSAQKSSKVVRGTVLTASNGDA